MKITVSYDIYIGEPPNHEVYRGIPLHDYKKEFGVHIFRDVDGVIHEHHPATGAVRLVSNYREVKQTVLSATDPELDGSQEENGDEDQED